MIDRITDWLALNGQFWVAVIGATIVKLIFSERMTIGKAAATGFAAIFSAWVCAAPTLRLFGLPPDYLVPIAALWGLTGENIMRNIIRKSGDKDLLSALFAAWRGK